MYQLLCTNCEINLKNILDNFVNCNVQEIPQMAKGVHHVSGIGGTMYILVSEVKTAL